MQISNVNNNNKDVYIYSETLRKGKARMFTLIPMGCNVFDV